MGLFEIMPASSVRIMPSALRMRMQQAPVQHLETARNCIDGIFFLNRLELSSCNEYRTPDKKRIPEVEKIAFAELVEP